MKIHPINQFVMLRFDAGDAELAHKSLTLAVPDKVRVPKRTATVVAVGRGLVTADGTIVPMQTKPGDRVIIADRTALIIEVEHEGEKLNVLENESHILGLITEE